MVFSGAVAMVMVDDIVRALRFYRDVLGFTVREEQEDWVLFNEGVGLQTSPEPLSDVRFAMNSVVVTLIVGDIQAAFEALTEKGVAFFLPPTDAGGAAVAAFRDTENNVLQLLQLA
jgi:predicted enzyme related to lactoylglutathione lyase